MRIFTDSAATSGETGDTSERIRTNLSNVKAILAVASAKGGAGKSTLAVNLGATLALRGRKVAIVDADLNEPSILSMLAIKPPRHLPMLEGIEPASGPHGLRVVSSEMLPGGEPPPASFLMDDTVVDGNSNHGPAEMGSSDALARMFAQTRFGVLDLLIVDLAPGLDRLHSLHRLVELQGALLLTNPSAHASKAARRAFEYAVAAGLPITGVIENMAGFNCDGCRTVRPLWPEGEILSLANGASIPLLARIAFEPRLAESSDRGTLFVRDYSATPTGKSLVDLASHIEAILAARARDVTAPQP
jgi:ATP-binding protein involved in chromosome partitioning